MRLGLSFDDVVIIPQYSEIETRKLVDVSTKLGSLQLSIPLISSNMDSITGVDMAVAMSRLGGLGILHRYQNGEKIVDTIKQLKELNCLAVPSVGIRPLDKELISEYADVGADAICIDVAHGDHFKCLEMVNFATKYFTNVIAGNVVTAEATRRLIKAGATIIKCGIGNGSLCSTRVVTGHGVPQFTALQDVFEVTQEYDAYLISDGGVKNSGDCVKALSRADAIMSGSLFAGCDETPTFEGGIKLYRGMASRQAREQFYGAAHDAVPEGEAVSLSIRKGPVKNVIDQLVGGIRSGLSYSGAFNISEFQAKAKLMQVTSAGHVEGTPHFLNRIS